MNTTDVESVPHDEQRIAYTPFRKAKTIEEGDFRYELTYGPDEQRRKSVLYKDGAPVETAFI